MKLSRHWRLTRRRVPATRRQLQPQQRRGSGQPRQRQQKQQVGTGKPWASRTDAINAVLVSTHLPNVCILVTAQLGPSQRPSASTASVQAFVSVIACVPCMLHAEAAKLAQAGLQNKLGRLKEEHEAQDKALREVSMPAKNILQASADEDIVCLTVPQGHTVVVLWYCCGSTSHSMVQ